MTEKADPKAEKAKLVQNERTKLTATWINGVAIAAIAVGSIAPVVAIVIGTAPAIGAVLMSSACSVIGIALHFAGRFILRRLEP